MYTNLNNYRAIRILIDGNKNIAVFSESKNPAYDGDDWTPMYLPSKTPYELKAPYTIEELAAVIEKGILAWEQHEPYTDKKVTFEEDYYKIKGFKNATLGKKYIALGWDDIGGKKVFLGLPSKTGKNYMGIEDIKLDDDADWIDFAKAVIELINLDLPNHHRFKTFKKRLNL